MAAQSRKGTLESRLQVVDILLRAGANVEQTDKFGSLPVDAVGGEGMAPLANKLVPAEPALLQAIQRGNLVQVQKEVAAPGAVNASFRNKTPLEYAVDKLLQHNDDNDKSTTMVDIIRVLIQAGANPTAGFAKESEETPLYLILSRLAQDLDQPTFKAAVTQFPASCVAADGWQLLQRAARRGNIPLLSYLLQDLQWNPNIKGRQGMTALQFAARSGRMDVLVSELL